MIRNKGLYGLTITAGTGTVFSGQTWLMFTNTGDSDATITCYEGDTVTFVATLLSGLSLNLGNRVDGNEWGKFVVDASATSVQALFEAANLDN